MHTIIVTEGPSIINVKVIMVENIMVEVMHGDLDRDEGGLVEVNHGDIDDDLVDVGNALW